MRRKSLLIVLSVVFLLVSTFGSSQVDSGFECITDLDCDLFLSDDYFPDEYYCDANAGKCFIEVVNPPVPEEALVSAPAPAIAVQEKPSLESQVTELQSYAAGLQSSVDNLLTKFTDLKDRLDALESSERFRQQQVTETKQQVQNLAGEASAVTENIEGLQEEVDTTQEELDALEKQITSRRRFIGAIIFAVILAIVGTIFYLFKGRERKIHPEINDYITEHIQQGKKYLHIKQNLQQAGWQDEHIDQAYNAVVKKNYQKYAKQQSKTKNLGPDKTKMIAIIVVAVLLITGVFFLLSGVVGQAIFSEKLVGGEAGGFAGEVTYEVECTPPQIVTPSGDSCCTDANADGVCDITERQVAEAQGQRCTDNLQCEGELCIDNKCGGIVDIYKGSPNCAKKCNYYSLHVSTSDGEIYRLKPGKGSYTAAGALEWRLLGAPDHCEGEKAVVPISIIWKDAGQVIGEEVITLRKGQTSRDLRHPNIQSVSFSLNMNNVFELCEEV